MGAAREDYRLHGRAAARSARPRTIDFRHPPNPARRLDFNRYDFSSKATDKPAGAHRL
jgi:hypothetical protein